MSSPYSSTQNSPGFRRGNLAARGIVTFVTGLGNSQDLGHVNPPKLTPLSGAGKAQDQRRRQNQGFSL